MSKFTSTLTASEAQEILNKHNCARQRYGLRPLVWNWEIAAHAQEHADRCIWDHASHLGFGVPGEGENLSLAMNKPVGVEGWLAEEPNYDCPNGTCASGTVCGHWTQMAWANTGQVGCGKRRCASLQKAPGFLNSDILVCRYTPPGNYVGQKMTSASQCDSGAANKTCAGGASSATVQAAPSAPTQTPVSASAPKPILAQTPITGSVVSSTQTNAPSTAATDRFSQEQQRVTQLQQSNLQNSNFVSTYRTQTSSRPSTNSDYQPLPNTLPVLNNNSDEGYAPAEETTQEKSDFARNVIIAVSVTIVVMIAVVAFLTYRYRHSIGKVYERVVERVQNKFPLVAGQLQLK